MITTVLSFVGPVLFGLGMLGLVVVILVLTTKKAN